MCLWRSEESNTPISAHSIVALPADEVLSELLWQLRIRMLVINYHLLRKRTLYQEAGETYFVERDRQAVEKQLVRRLIRLGYQVELQPVPQAG